MSDNGPQYSSNLFPEFAKAYNFCHQTSSPRYPQANGATEKAVRTMKSLLEKNNDHYIAMLAYRLTPLENGYSLAHLSMGRNIRTTLRVLQKKMKPNLPSYIQNSNKKNRSLDLCKKRNFDSHHNTRCLPCLELVSFPEGGVWERDYS